MQSENDFCKLAYTCICQLSSSFFPIIGLSYLPSCLWTPGVSPVHMTVENHLVIVPFLCSRDVYRFAT